VRRSLQLIPVVVVLACGLTACSEQSPGQAVGSETTRSTSTGSGGPFSTGPTKTSISQPSAAPSPIKDTKPCSLLSAAEVAELRAGQSVEERLNKARSCNFDKGQGFALGVAIFDELGMDDITGRTQPTPVPTVGKHKAVRWIGGIDSCVISLEVAKTTRVDVQAAANGNEQKSCEIALQAAKYVEQKLP
jgi:hypothetical protein